MKEFPNKYPNEHAFVQASNITTPAHTAEFSQSRPTFEDVFRVMNLMTSQDIRIMDSHGGKIINPKEYPTFDALFAVREQIRDLHLVPVRSNAVQHEYNRMNKETFLRIVNEHYFDGSQLSIVKEMYPTDLPYDVLQYVVWIKDDIVDDYTIAEFIARAARMVGVSTEEIILFERSRVTRTPFVRAAVPEHRHIHMWVKNKTLQLAS